MGKKSGVLLLLLFGLACLGGLLPSVGWGQSKEPVKIGLLTPLSPPGDQASGKWIQWGAELGIKYVNEEMKGVLGGRPVQLVVADDQGVPAEGVAGYRRLVTNDRVVAVIGQFHSSVCIAVSEVAKELGVPLFSTGASAAKITGSRYPTIFSIMGLIPNRAEFYIEFAKEMGWKRVVVLGEDTDYGTEFKKWVEEYGKKEGIEVKSIIFPRTITDLTPSLLIIKSWKPDFVINAGIPPAAYIVVKQAYDVGLFPKVAMLATYDWTNRPEYWDAVGDKGNYILYMAYYKPGMPVSASGGWMIPRYIAQYKEDPTFYGMNAFGEVLVVAQAIDQAKSEKPKDVLTALTTKRFTDWSGPIKFEDLPGMRWHNVSPPMLLLQMTKPRQPGKEANIVWPPSKGGNGKVEMP